jgi:glucose/arabinose dehydrogenase
MAVRWRWWRLAAALAACAACGDGAAAPQATGGLQPKLDGADAKRPQLPVRLVQVAAGFEQITDIQFPPGRSDEGVVLGKAGTAWWFAADGKSGPWFSVEVLTQSEQGLLGLAFHPKFAENGLFYVHYSPKGGERRGRIAEWSVTPGKPLAEAKPAEKRVLLEIPQPYANHDGGCLQFGPDGFLYIGMGDGGSGGDPHGHGQDRGTLLGDMLRIDVNGKTGDKPYGIPADNPFLAEPGVQPEIWAYGLRNPWRFSFTKDGRLVAGDVGQNAWEEITFVERGGNHGWNVWEARHCFEKKTCPDAGFVMPIYEYGHDEGVSVSGGYEVTAPGPLAGKYVFGDFGTGRIWALDLPADSSKLVPATALGRFDIQPATFGRDGEGRVYVGDFGGGIVYRIDPAS